MSRFQIIHATFAAKKAKELKAAVDGRTLTACQHAYAVMIGYSNWAEMAAVAASKRYAPSPLDETVSADERAGRETYQADRLAALWGIPPEESLALVHKVRPTASTSASNRPHDGMDALPIAEEMRAWFRNKFRRAIDEAHFDDNTRGYYGAEAPLSFDIADELREGFPHAGNGVIREVAANLFELGPWVRAELVDGDPDRELEEMEADRAAIRRAMEAHPTLNYSGFGIHDSGWSRWTAEERRSALAERRTSMLTDNAVAEFRLAQDYLNRLERRKSANPDVNSYWLKHRATDWHSGVGTSDTYMSNGMFIAAALALGLIVLPVYGTPNAQIGVTTRSVKRMNASAGTDAF